MNNKIIDISTPLREGAPVWPGSAGVSARWTLRVENNDPSNLTRLDTDIHIGTHIEGALHSFANGAPVDQIPLNELIGPAMVVALPGVNIIGYKELEAARIPAGTKRLLLRTRNSDLWQSGESQFQKDFVGLNTDGAQWVVDRGINLVGIDYLSVACYDEGLQVHKILLINKIIVLEGLNLSKALDGEYQLICLPILLPGREAAPARAILQTL